MSLNPSPINEQLEDTRWANRIVFLCLSALGDMMLSLPLIQQTRSLYKNAKITIVCSRPATAALARQLGVADDVLLLPTRARRSPLQLWRSLSMMRSLKADIALQTFASHGAFANLMLGATNARIRCGFANGRFQSRLTHSLPISEKHYITLNLDLLRRLGHGDIEDPGGRYLPSIEKESTRFPLNELPKRYGRYAIISISSDPALSFKRWPLEQWRKLCQQLSDDGLHLLFVGAETDKKDIADILQNTDIHAENLAGKTDFSDLASLIKQSLIVIGTDGMLLHFAASLDKPCVGLFGPTSAQREGPWRQAAHCVSLSLPGFPCYSANSAKLPPPSRLRDGMNRLPVNQVYERIRAVLSESFPPDTFSS